MQYIHYKQVKQDKAPAFYIVCTLQIMIISFCILISSSVGSWIKDLITAVLLALFGIPVYFICKKVNAVRIMNSVLNAMAIGVCIGSLYNYKEISLQFADIIAPMAISIFLVIINNVILVRWERIGWLLLINLLI